MSFYETQRDAQLLAVLTQIKNQLRLQIMAQNALLTIEALYLGHSNSTFAQSDYRQKYADLMNTYDKDRRNMQ